MMKTSILILLTAAATFLCADAQERFYSASLARLFQSLPASCRNTTAASPIDTVVACTAIVNSETATIAYEYDETGSLIHLGWRFMPQLTNLLANPTVTRFLERETLKLIISQTPENVFMSYKWSEFYILMNGKPLSANFKVNKQSFIKLLKSVADVNISSYDGKKYEVKLTDKRKQTLSYIFPADVELLTGMDKKERDECLAAQLRSHRQKTPTDSAVNRVGKVTLLHDSVWVLRGDSFMMHKINNDLYYLKDDSVFNLAFNSALVAETFSNTLIAPMKHSYSINITHRQYGNTKISYQVSSRDFDDFFLNGYDRFFGVETLDKKKLTGTLVLRDRYAGSIHLAYVTVALEALLNGGAMDMTLYSNIPQHNIEAVFAK